MLTKRTDWRAWGLAGAFGVLVLFGTTAVYAFSDLPASWWTPHFLEDRERGFGLKQYFKWDSVREEYLLGCLKVVRWRKQTPAEIGTHLQYQEG